jgi:hypothetical protein
MTIIIDLYPNNNQLKYLLETIYIKTLYYCKDNGFNINFYVIHTNLLLI